MKISDREFKPFSLNTVFSITSTINGIDGNKLQKNDGEHPYITRTDLCNGITNFLDKQENYKLNDGNCITVGLDTQTCFYQPKPFYTGQNIQILRNEKLNENIALFILPLLKKVLSVFSWGSNGATLSRLQRTKIMLPINEKQQIDFKFMNDFIEEQRMKTSTSFENFINNDFLSCSFKEINDLSKCTWKKFNLKDIFETIVSGCCKNASIVKDGDIPYIGATNRNNGVMKFVDVDKTLISDGNCIICIGGGDGSAGLSIYKFEPSFVASSSICCYSKKINPYIGLFISCCIDMSVFTDNDHIHRKYSRGNPRGRSRLMRDAIMLPSKNNEPDYEYMEQYIKNIIVAKKENYISKSNIINNTTNGN